MERESAEEAERLRRDGTAVRATARRIWLEPGFPMLQPVKADVEERLQSWVWAPDSLPISDAARTALERWAYERFDALYKAWSEDADANAEAERAFEADAIALARQLHAELGTDWQVGLFSVKLDQPVWDLDDMPDDEWLHRFGHTPPRDD